MAALNLDAITAELWGEKNDPENVQLREAAGESHRIIEVVRAQQPHRYGGSMRGGRGGYMIPDTLLLAEVNERLELNRRSARHESMIAATQRRLIEAAVTTTNTAVGIIDPMVLQGDLVDTLIGINGLISYCSIYPNLSSPISIPRVTAAPRAAAVAEGAAASTAATLTIDDIDFVPKQLRVFWSITPESYVTSQGRSPSIAVSEAGRLMMDEAEEELWQGNNAAGRVAGIEHGFVAARNADYAADRQRRRAESRGARPADQDVSGEDPHHEPAVGGHARHVRVGRPAVPRRGRRGPGDDGRDDRPDDVRVPFMESTYPY